MASEIGKRDSNFVPVLMLEKDDGSGEVMMARADSSGRLMVTATGGSGDVSGPGSSTDNAVVRWNGAAGTDIQNSAVIIDDSNNVTGVVALTASGAIRSATSLILEETGAGTDIITIVAPASIAASYTLTLPTTDGNNLEFLQTDGSGTLAWAVPTAAAGGSDTQVQFNDGGSALGGDAGFVYSKTTNTATLDVIQLTNSGLKMLDTDASHYLIITPGSDLSANRILTITTGDSARTIQLDANLTVAATASVSGTLVAASSKTFTSSNTLTLSGTDGIAVALGANDITLTTGGATTITLPTTGTLATLDGVENFSNKTLTTPVLGVATATSINKVTITAPTSSATLTLVDGSSLITVGANAITLTSVGSTGVTLPTTGTLSTLAGAEELTNKTLNASVGKGTWTASGTWQLPAITTGGLVTMAANILFGENTELLLDPALSADGKYCGITEGGTAGATLAFGDLCYLAAADSRWELADASAAATAGDVKIGICVLAAAADASPTTMLLYGKIRADAVFPAFTISAPVHISETAGDVVVAAPTTTDSVTRRVGFANTADELFFCPSPDFYTHV